MSAIYFTCPSCSRRLKIRSGSEGKRLDCPKCGTRIKVPGGPPAETVDMAEAVVKSPAENQSEDQYEDDQEPSQAGWWKTRNLASQLRSGKIGQRVEAARELGKIGNEQAIAALAAALVDRDLDVRREAAESLKQLDWGDTPAEKVRLALSAGDPKDAAAIGAEAVPALLDILAGKDDDDRKLAIEALGSIGDRRATVPIIAALSEPALRAPAAVALGDLADPAALDPLIGALDDASVRARAALSLGKLGDVCAVEPLLPLLGDADDAVFCATADALCRLGDRRATKSLVEALETPIRRVHAARTLEIVADPRATKSLRRYFDSVRETIARTRALLEQTAEPARAKGAVAELKNLLEADRDLLPVEELLQASELEDVEGEVEIVVRGPDGPKKRKEKQVVRTMQVTQLAMDELQRRKFERKDEALGLMRRANAYLDGKQFAKAIEDFTAAIAKNPHFSTAFNNRGCAYASEGKFSQAIADFTTAIQLDPSSITSLMNRADANTDAGKLEKADADLSAAIAQEPSADHYAARGRVRLSMGRCVDAGDDFSAAIRIQPSAELYNERGATYFLQGRYDAACADFADSIKQSPTAEAHFNCGYALYASSKFPAAVEQFTHAMKLDPNLEALSFRGNAHLGAGNPKAAISDYEARIKQKLSGAVLYSLGYARLLIGDLNGAVAALDEAIALRPKHAHAFALRGTAKAALGLADEAKNDLERAVALDPSCDAAFSNLALIKRRQGDIAAAIADQTHALACSPDNAVAFRNRALARLATSDVKGAKSDMSHALTLEPALAEAEFFGN